uniref:CCHC-type domain-containing protein n=1 Tax=Musca domestica TaxID=7370 RepID=A0A1I8NL69_MUSDO
MVHSPKRRTNKQNPQPTQKGEQRKQRSNSKYHPYKSDIYKCNMCNKFHALSSCPKFLRMSPKERNRYVLKNVYCVNCLARSHRFRDCKSKYVCWKCGKYHHTLLHPNHRHNPKDQSQVTISNQETGTQGPDNYILSEAIRSLASVLCVTHQSTSVLARRHVQTS